MKGIYKHNPDTILSKTMNKLVNFPLNLVLVVTYRCNSKCKTCNIWKKKEKNPLNLYEYSEIFKNMKSVPWATIEGGEPFLKSDFEKIVISFIKECNPLFVNIPSNGSKPKKISKIVKNILKNTLKTKITINLSYDGYKERHNKIRGLNNNYGLLKSTYNNLSSIDSQRLTIGINTTLSKYNINEYQKIYQDVIENFNPDSYVIEIAQNRRDLFNWDQNLHKKSSKLVEAIKCYLKLFYNESNSKFAPSIIKSFRHLYYKEIIESLRGENKKRKCYAGSTSCQISPRGDVWTCAVAKKKMGNLRDFDYNFIKLWNSERAKNIRQRKGFKECKNCNLANVFYSNILQNLTGSIEVLANFMKSHI